MNLLSYYTNINLDGYAGLLVSLLVGYAGYKSMMETTSPLLGEAPNPMLVHQIRNIVLPHDGVLDVHDLVIHDYGPGRILITLHAEVPADKTLLEVHDIIDHIERELKETLQLSATIHIDPEDINNPHFMELRSRIRNELSHYDSQLSTHDFHITDFDGQEKVTFDMNVPYDDPRDDEEIIREVKTLLSDVVEKSEVWIEIDRVK